MWKRLVTGSTVLKTADPTENVEDLSRRHFLSLKKNRSVLNGDESTG